jgi:hypothetical protein
MPRARTVRYDDIWPFNSTEMLSASSRSHVRRRRGRPPGPRARAKWDRLLKHVIALYGAGKSPEEIALQLEVEHGIPAGGLPPRVIREYLDAR